MMPQLTREAKIVALVDTLAAARAIRREGRAQRLAAQTPHLSGKAKTDVLGEALELARAIQSSEARVHALAALAPQLSGDAKTEILDEALQRRRG